MFASLLIANRGEIACRVIKTARRMGMRTIAVYSDADAGARHVALADAAFRIGPAPARDSYLRSEAILEAARRGGAEAIHPGYGFLSENASFAEACASAGVTFVGPPASAIRAMGLKDAAKALMAKAGVPVVPGYHGDDQTDATLAREAGQIGFPVLIKAVAGGGGKGMRRVDSAAAFAEALSSCRREAEAAFGDARVLVEKYVSTPRHIEIQVFADAHGNAVHLFERDCSLQRRHQKVIEEAPAPGMPEAMRARMGAAAVAAAKAIGYRGAGTVEFIADASQGLNADRFYFMEMNTRLQVEHPVTEMITGLDLVEWQLRVAAGEALPRRQEEVAIAGHAVEARVYAEDPAKGFLPSTGTLHRLRLPSEDPHVRVDTGVREGDTVSVHYDPMIAKIIVWDHTRAGALRRLSGAMESVEVAGLSSNAAFLAEVASHDAFRSGAVDTGFIERHKAALIASSDADAETAFLAALSVLLRRRDSNPACSPWDHRDGFRLHGAASETVELRHGAGILRVEATYARDGGFALRLGEREVCATGVIENGRLIAELDGVRISAGVAHAGRTSTLMWRGRSFAFDAGGALDHDDAGEGRAAQLTAPMPGKIVQVLAAAGQTVAKGQALVVLEAMKMEHTLSAPAEQTIARIHCAPGEQVTEGTVVVSFAEDQ